MEKEDKIKDLFQERFTDFEAKVDAGIWNSIQAKMVPNTVPVATSIVSKTSMFIAASVLVAASVGYFIFSDLDGARKPSNEINQTENSLAEEESNKNATQNMGKEFVRKVKTIGEPVGSEEKSTISKSTEVSADEGQLQKSKTSGASPIATEETPASLADKALIENATHDEFVEVGSKEAVSAEVEHKIIVKDQSSVVASPMGGNAPLTVSFSCLAKLKKVKWKFDDGAESTEQNPVHEYTTPGIYFVTMMAQLENGNMVMDKAIVEVKAPAVEENLAHSESDIFVPNIFTPNGDGLHDELIIETTSINSYTVAIYEVDGTLVFSSQNGNKNWQGKDLNGIDLPEATYYYLIEAAGEDGKMYAPKGYIALRRN